MFRTVAREVDSDAGRPQYPDLLQEVFQWKPKPKGKKHKSQIDDTRTEISYSASTAAGDTDLETSTYVSKDLANPSSHSVESKRSKKRSKKSPKENSGSIYSGETAAPETPESSKNVPSGASHLVTLTCPLCYDDDCVLNKAAQCPLLRHNDTESQNECCVFCGTNCRCEENKGKFLPVSGLVARDGNGVAVTLLKANGGPIENSFEWANRRRWVVPSHVRWEHKISEWITAPLQETSKADAFPRKKSHKLRNKRKSKAPALATTTELISNSEEPRVEEEDQEVKLILEGQGFKIFEKGKDKILINYERRNCKRLGCSCVPAVETTNCGCGDLRVNGEKIPVKHHKNCSNKRNVSLVKETSQGVVPLLKELEEKFAKEKTKSNDSAPQKSELPPKEDGESLKSRSNPKLKQAEAEQEKLKKDGKGKNNLIPLSAKDIRNRSRADVLEESLRNLLGKEYKNGEAESHQNDDAYVGVPCPGATFGGDLGPCICAQGCPYPPQ